MKRLQLTLAFVLALAVSVLAQYPGARPVDQEVEVGFQDIKEADCKGWLEVLASDAYGGRQTGSEGYRLAAKFMAERFQEFGLTPIGENGGYYQTVTLYRLQSGGEGPLVTNDEIRLEGQEIGQYLSDGDAEAEVVAIFAGNKAELDDPEVVRGKIVMLNTHRDVLKAPLYRQIKEARPAGIVLMKGCHSPFSRVYPGRLAQGWDARTPLVVVDDDAYIAILKACGLKSAFGGKAPKTGMKLGLSDKKLRVKTTAQVETIEAPNVIGMLEGSHPELKSEYVICGSHLDHLGVGPNGEIFNGADDDASGSTALLAVARAFAKNPTRPQRSLIFLAVCAEEDGLLGSEFYVENPIVPIKDTICELQIDMVGRNEEGKGDRPENNVRTTHLVGTKRLSVDLHKLILDVNKHVKFDFEFDEEGIWNRSDHYNFARKGIPIAFVFSGFHPDYHKPTDTIEKINFEKLANTARLIYLTAFTAADRTKRIVKDRDLPEE